MERWCGSTHIRSTTKVKENGQRISLSDDNVPGAPPEPHPPSTNPVDTTRLLDEPPSVELKGERISYPSDDVRLTSANADVPGLSEDDKDARDRSKNP